MAPRNVLETATKVRDEFLCEYPEDRIKAEGKLKKLKGKEEGKLQYDLPSSYRLIYTVDREAKRVKVEFIGYHPNWK